MPAGKEEWSALLSCLQHIPIFSSGKLNLITTWINIYGYGRGR
jgi:hypothetical protein